MSKPRVVKDYNKLSKKLITQLKKKYPYGFEKHLITFKNHKNKFVSALPFESDEYHYLIKMTIAQAQKIIRADEELKIGEK